MKASCTFYDQCSLSRLSANGNEIIMDKKLLLTSTLLWENIINTRQKLIKILTVARVMRIY
jgi:hypothetical protein